MRSHSEASTYLGSKTDRPLPGRATRLQRREDGSIAVRYQATDVVTYRPDGTIALDSGGWLTSTTKARINEYTRAHVYAVKGQWALSDGPSWEARQTSVYYDGMLIDENGTPFAPKFPTKTDTAIKRQLDRAVSAYIRGFAAMIEAGELEPPSSGDCWGCLMNPVDAKPVTQGPFGRANRPTPHGRVEIMGVDHYLSHMGLGEDADERYYVPSLLVNAIKARAYRDPGFIWQMIASRKDGSMAAGILRAFFRNLKSALLAELQARRVEVAS